MLLRSRQKTFVQRCLQALHKHGNTLGIAPTGFGKTIALSGVVGELLKKGGKACILAHRDELTQQNMGKFRVLYPHRSTSIFDRKNKDFSGQVTGAMVQTLHRNLWSMPVLSLLVIDETHHVPAKSYARIIKRAYELNPHLLLFGVTATPSRGDKKRLRAFFSNIGDQVSVRELIESGHLVPPKTFVMNVGTQEALKNVAKIANDYDMKQVDAIMNKRPVSEAVVKHWKEKAHNRQTIIFCSTIEHAKNVYESFLEEGIPSGCLHGQLSIEQRDKVLKDYSSFKTRVLVNVALLTEGWDSPSTSCVVLLRPSSYKSTMIQMIGRGLRPLNNQEYINTVKTDCVVLDFGISTLLHGSIEQSFSLNVPDSTTQSPKISPQKECPECQVFVPIFTTECPICHYSWKVKEEDKRTLLKEFSMLEIDLLNKSSFVWVDIFKDGQSFLATGFTAWGGIFCFQKQWFAVGGGKTKVARLLTIGERTVCLAKANDWLNTHETDESAHKSKKWIHQLPTRKQTTLLPSCKKMDFNLTRYEASAFLTYKFHKSAIKNLVMKTSQKVA